ncbi:MAG: cyclic 2,3-diphosphoglycerate synthase [Desulfurococcaceae archaeon]|uniref:GTPase n=1 Tax=Staphylothermus marinus TaxID=2280 RepID=A0A7C4HBD2_STAMA
MVRKVLIIGASGRDYHNFNIYFRNNPNYRVVAFLQTQLPGIAGRRYPPSLAGELYREGIPILHIEYLEEIVKKYGVDEAVLSYSDLSYDELGRIISRLIACGLSFRILGLKDTMIESSKPVIAVTAVKTGAGKSSVSREIANVLIRRGFRVGVVRHPMAYGDLEKTVVQIIRSIDDLNKYNATIEEREEYEHYIEQGLTIYAGVDYGKLLNIIEKERDIILWDGGNNDWPFYKPDYMVTVADAMRPGLEVKTYPGEVNIRLANTIIINKVDQAQPGAVEYIVKNIKEVNPNAKISLAESEVSVDKPELLFGNKALVVEDAPTVTHGGSPYAAGYVAAKKYGAEIVDPRPYATPFFRKIYEEYPHLGPVLPSMGYRSDQLMELQEVINSTPADVVVLGTPSNLARLIKINKPVVRVKFRIKIIEGPSIEDIVNEFLEKTRFKIG